MLGPFRLVPRKKAFGSELYIPWRDAWGYALNYWLKSWFRETPYSIVLWRLWLLVVPDGRSKGQTRSPIELFWTAKNYWVNLALFWWEANDVFWNTLQPPRVFNQKSDIYLNGLGALKHLKREIGPFIKRKLCLLTHKFSEFLNYIMEPHNKFLMQYSWKLLKGEERKNSWKRKIMMIEVWNFWNWWIT